MIKSYKKNKPLIFIHTPKCGGTYASTILNNLNIINNGHLQANDNEDGITFTIIRNPIERYESLLNYRLCNRRPGNDWPKHLLHVFCKKHITLNDIIKSMSDDEILGFNPYNNLIYWTQNIDIIITIDKLEELLHNFGYKYDKTEYDNQNVSIKERGTFNIETKNRLKQLYDDDIILYNKWC